MFCKKCGKEINNNVCDNCGAQQYMNIDDKTSFWKIKMMRAFDVIHMEHNLITTFRCNNCNNVVSLSTNYDYMELVDMEIVKAFNYNARNYDFTICPKCKLSMVKAVFPTKKYVNSLFNNCTLNVTNYFEIDGLRIENKGD